MSDEVDVEQLEAIRRVISALAHDGAQPLDRCAITYAKGGLEIHPLHPGDKTPLVSQYQATTDTALIANWWGMWPEALIGHRVAVGHLLLDIDPRHGGDETWELLDETFGPIQIGRQHYSGRGDGGFHLWAAWSEGVNISTKRLDAWAQEHEVGQPIYNNKTGKVVRWTSGIDVLHHDWRYTILPPSPHPDTGKPYFWPDVIGVPVALPPGMVELLTAPETTAAEHPAEVPRQATATSVPVQVLEHSDSVADWITATTTWAQILRPHGWTLVQGDGEADGSLWRHPDADRAHHHSASVKHGCLFVYSNGTVFEVTGGGDTNGITKFKAWAVLEHDGDQSAAARSARALKTGQSLAVTPVVPAIARAQGGLRTLADLLANTTDVYDWLIPDLIERHDRLMLTGGEGGGKSTLLRQIGLSVSAGLHPFTGQDMTPLRVLLVDCENSEKQLEREFIKALRALVLAGRTDEATKRLYVETRSEGLVLDVLADPDGDRAWLEEAVTNAQPDLLILGPVYKLIQGDPTEEPPSRELAKFLDRLRVRYGFALALEAHSPHDLKRPFGWSGWKRWPEFGLHLDAGGTVSRWRGDREERSWPAQLRRGGRGEWPWMPSIGAAPTPMTPRERLYAEVRDDVIKVLRQAKVPLDRDQIQERAGRQRTSVLKVLRELEDRTGVIVTHGPPQVSGNPPELFEINPQGYLAPTS